MTEKYLYFRTEATDANDDAVGDSVCWPASSLMGMYPVTDSRLQLFFTPITRRDPTGSLDAEVNLDIHDSVLLELASANTHLAAIRAITEAIGNPNIPNLIVVANHDSDGTEYLASSGVNACGAITVHGLYTQS